MIELPRQKRIVICWLMDHSQKKESFRWKYNPRKRCYERLTISFGTIEYKHISELQRLTSDQEVCVFFWPFSWWRKLCNVFGIACYGACFWDKFTSDNATIKL